LADEEAVEVDPGVVEEEKEEEGGGLVPPLRVLEEVERGTEEGVEEEAGVGLGGVPE
jgi:hypothetical protein